MLIRTGSSKAAPYVNYSVGRAPHPAQLARGIKELEASVICAVVALHLAGKDNSVADALPRFSIRARGSGPFAERELRHKYRLEVSRR